MAQGGSDLAALPEDLPSPSLRAYRRLGEGSAEDSPEASFAGQQETF